MRKNVFALLFLGTLTAALLRAEEKGCGKGSCRPGCVEDLFTVECECKVPQYTCDECRYELGLVKIDPSLVRSEENPGGLFRLATVGKRAAQTLLAMNGEIALNANALSRVSSRAPGLVRAVYADVGARVEKGAILFEVESPELGRAVGAYRKNKALAALALKNLERENALAAKKLSAEADRVEAQMKYDEYRIELEAAANELAVLGLDAAAVAELTSDAAQGRSAALPVRAPRAGTVVERSVTPGEVLETGQGAMLLAELSTVWAWLSLHERDWARVLDESKKGPPRVRIETAAFPGKVFEGEIERIGPTVNEEERTLKVRAVLKNPDALLRPGMFCAATAVFETPERVVAVPKEAVLEDEGRAFVFRKIRDGFVLRTDVETGRVFADSIEITRGLAEGETIVTEGAFACKSDVLRAKMGAGCAD